MMLSSKAIFTKSLNPNDFLTEEGIVILFLESMVMGS